jgi:hypothetical protein
VEDLVAATLDELAIYQDKKGIFAQGYVLKAARTMAPALWWATFAKHLPKLQAVAHTVLSQVSWNGSALQPAPHGQLTFF